jgi:hypothetical protein
MSYEALAISLLISSGKSMAKYRHGLAKYGKLTGEKKQLLIDLSSQSPVF